MKYFLLIGALLLLGAGCSSGPSYNSDNYSYSSGSSNYYSSGDDDEVDYSDASPENPYDEGSGHSAGFEWAQENEPSECGGNSDSFIEGCEEYMSQQAEIDENY